LADADISFGNGSLNFTYHINNIDAQNGTNALISPYMNEVPYNQVVFARVQDPETDLFSIVELELHVVPVLPINPPMDIVMIDEDGDGIVVFDLTVNDAIVLEGLYPLGYIVSYYDSENDAVSGEYPMSDPDAYYNIENPQTIYMRIENISGSCVAIASFIISVETLSVESLGFENLSIFPNPSSGNITISSSQLVSETSISLYDILGKKLLSDRIIPQNGTVSLDISSFENGVYFVKISCLPSGTASERKEVVRKIIKG